MSDLLGRDATDQLAALAAKKISAVELLDLSLARCRSHNPAINAVVVTDPEPARQAALAIDAARLRGEPLGPLAGLPMTVKDTLDVVGMAASGGIERYRHRQAQDAVVVARAKAAGAVVWGKTNTPVMAGDWQSYNEVFGTTNNPWDLERTPGGSSGGSAAALAARITALEIGSDIAGSLRVPASFCGVMAHKPTLHLVPKIGEVPPAPGTLSPKDLSVIGPLARSVRDLALLLSVLSDGATPAQVAPAEVKTLKVGLWLDDPAMMLDADVRSTIETWSGEVAAAGVAIEPIASPVDAAALLATYNFLLMSNLGGGFPEKAWNKWADKRDLAQSRMRKGAGPLSYPASILAATASHREWLRHDEVRHRLMAAMAEAFESHDVIVTPVAPVEPFLHDHSDFHHRKLTCSNGEKIDYALMKTWVGLAIACGLPATAIPAGLSPRGLPVGVQVIGPHGRDADTLGAAMTLARAAGGYRPPPELF